MATRVVGRWPGPRGTGAARCPRPPCRRARAPACGRRPASGSRRRRCPRTARAPWVAAGWPRGCRPAGHSARPLPRSNSVKRQGPPGWPTVGSGAVLQQRVFHGDPGLRTIGRQRQALEAQIVAWPAAARRVHREMRRQREAGAAAGRRARIRARTAQRPCAPSPSVDHTSVPVAGRQRMASASGCGGASRRVTSSSSGAPSRSADSGRPQCIEARVRVGRR